MIRAETVVIDDILVVIKTCLDKDLSDTAVYGACVRLLDAITETLTGGVVQSAHACHATSPERTLRSIGQNEIRQDSISDGIRGDYGDEPIGPLASLVDRH